MGHLLRQVIYGSTAFVVGMMAYFSFVETLRFFKDGKRLTAAYALTWFCISGILGLFLWYVIAPLEDLGVRPETWVFGALMVGLCFGLIGIATEYMSKPSDRMEN